MRQVTEAVRTRFWRKVEKTDGCWLWRGAKKAKGYGNFGLAAGVTVLAHRFAYEIERGDVPQGTYVCHSCDNPSCVRPDHLFLGTPTDNARDMMGKGRFVGNRYGEKTECVRGHPLSGDNLIVGADGYRRCRICTNAKMRERRRRARTTGPSHRP